MAPGPTARPVPMAASRTVAVLKQALVSAPGRQPSALGCGDDRRIETVLEAAP